MVAITLRVDAAMSGAGFVCKSGRGSIRISVATGLPGLRPLGRTTLLLLGGQTGSGDGFNRYKQKPV